MAYHANILRKDRGARKATDGRLLKESGPSAFLNQVFTKVKPKKQEAAPNSQTPQNSGVSSADPITLIIAKHPEMNASTFYNLLKSQGFVISSPADLQKEADSSSAHAPVLRKESKTGVGFKTRIFLESAQPVEDNKSGTTRYKVVMLEEGMGNFGASAYYSKEALQTAIPIFEGKKIYADHPAESEADERPERSVRDILGHFENVHVQEAKAGGQTWLCADLVVMGGSSYQWARELMEHAVIYAKKFPDKEFVGLSINASGDSEALPLESVIKKGVPEGALAKIREAKLQGIETLTYVSAFKEAVSCDLVTEAGAGGKILDLIEGAKKKEGGPGSGPQPGGGPTTLKDRKAAEDKAKNEKILKKFYSKNPKDIESHIKSLMNTKSEDNMNKKESTEANDKEALEKKEADGTTGDEQDGHADANQDMALIKKMIAKHGGAKDGEEVSDEECAVVKEAYEAHKEMGLEGEAAESEAVKYLKASKHMAAKREAAAKEASAKDSSAGSESSADDKKDESVESKGDESKESKEGSVKESAQKSELEKVKQDNLKLQGQLAALTEAGRKSQVTAHVDKVCKESKLLNPVTASFKKLVEGAKSVEEVDKAWGLFQEGYRSKKSSAEGGLDFGGMTIEAEKSTFVESSSQAGVNFGACVIED